VADPSLTQVLFDPTQSDVFDPKGEKLKTLVFLGEIFKTQTQKKMADPTQNFLAQSHH